MSQDAGGPTATARNRANWDERAAVHGQDGYYDLDALVAGADTLTDLEDAALALAGRPDVRDVDVLHLQCHLGFDAVSLARRGARVTGADFSAVAVRRAAGIATRCGVPVEYLQADATDLPASRHGRFDLGDATVGILCWISDVDAWMRSVTARLRPGSVTGGGRRCRVAGVLHAHRAPSVTVTGRRSCGPR